MAHIEKMKSRDWLWPVIFLILGAAGAFTAYKLFFQAFPEASIDLRLTREEVAGRSLDFLRGRGLNTDGYRSVTIFDYDGQAKTYLERELGLEAANRAMSSTVRIWRWRTRLFKPPQKEEMSVWLTTSGELVGFDHKIDEAAPGAKLDKDEAQRIAEIFLRSERHLDLSQYKLVDDKVETRPARLDYTFTWEEQGMKLKDATRRLSVTVTGDNVGGFREFLKIPDQWERDYQTLRSKNDLLQNIANASYVLLLAGAIFIIARSARMRRIHWKAAVVIGAVVGALFAIQLWNSLPQAMLQMPTNSPYETTAAILAVGFLIAGVVIGLYTMMLAGSGEPLYRELSPDRVALNHLFTFHGLRTKEFFSSTLIGYGMAGMHLGLVVLFYTVALKFGGWAPLDVNYDNTISTALPWVSPLATALMAATTEEFGFRLFAIPLMLRLTRSKVLAVIIPAFMWGFLHSSYPQQPAWFRGVEVGLIGIVAGWVFLRFGILATLVWHYTVDAVLMAMFLMRSGVLTYRVSGALVGDAVLVPLLISVVFYLESRGFLADNRILNSALDEAPVPKVAFDATASGVEVPEEIARLAEAAARREEERKAAAVERKAPPFQFLPAPGMRLLVGAAILAAGVLYWIKVPTVGGEMEIRVDPQRAEAVAAKYLHERGVNVESYRRVTRLSDGIPGPATDYLLERYSPAMVGGIYKTDVPVVFYSTRFFIPGQKEEYEVLTRLDGKPERYVHTLDEKAPGAQLDKPEAQARAELYLRKRQVSLESFQIVQHDLEQRDARIDHLITWEDKMPTLTDNARHRISVAVKGEEVTGPRHWIKIPEAWEREHTRQTIWLTLPIILIITGGLLAVILAARAVARVVPRWRFHLNLGGIGAALFLVQQMNGARAWAVNYETSVSWSNYATQQSLILLMLTVGVFVGIAALSLVAEVLLAERFDGVTFWAPRGPNRARALAEGLFAGVSAALILAATRTITAHLLEKIPSVVRNAPSGLPSVPVAESAALALFLGGVIGSFWSALALAAGAGVLLRVLRKPGLAAAGLFVIVTMLAAAPSLSAIHFVKLWLSLAIYILVLGALVLLLRFNLMSYLVLYTTLAAASVIPVVWAHDGLHQFYFHAALGFLLLAVGLVIWCRMELNRAA